MLKPSAIRPRKVVLPRVMQCETLALPRAVGPLVRLTAAHLNVVQFMVWGSRTSRTIQHPNDRVAPIHVKANDPLGLEPAALLAGVRLRIARRLAEQPLFQAALAQERRSRYQDVAE